MLRKKSRKEKANALLLNIKREMAMPRKAKSARDAEAKLAAAQIKRSQREKLKPR
jgi:hypothetical protein